MVTGIHVEMGRVAMAQVAMVLVVVVLVAVGQMMARKSVEKGRKTKG